MKTFLLMFLLSLVHPKQGKEVIRLDDKELKQTDKHPIHFQFIGDQASQPIIDSILEAHSQAGIPSKKTHKKRNQPSM